MQHSLHNFGLHQAALIGDDEGVQEALDAGANINALDIAGRTAIMCAIAGENWNDFDASDASFLTSERLNVIRIMLRHPGMAAWLNMPEVVCLLLEISSGSVTVDGMDSHGATALMYAARDSNLEVVQLLLLHGSRPDFRDRNHRTPVQFALPHPQILWLCETVLRRHRWRESVSADRCKLFSQSEHLLQLVKSSLSSSDNFEPPPLSVFTEDAISRLTGTLVSSVRSSELSFLHSLLFSPPLPPTSHATLYPMSVPLLVNRTDSKGWSPMHYCVAAESLSIDVLDTLYCAGADVSLFTVDQQEDTPLHILARSASIGQMPSNLHDFTFHLIHDLRAPLSARNKQDETCIHVAAEHGTCIDLLKFFLDCDSTGCVRELRNARGLTAFEVCKSEFQPAFGSDTDERLSNQNFHQSFSSLATLSEWSPAVSEDDALSLYSPSEADLSGQAHQLLSNLRLTSPSCRHSNDLAHIRQLESIIDDTRELSHAILSKFRARLDTAVKEVQDLRGHLERTAVLRNVVAHAANGKIAVRGLPLILTRKKNRDSEDSQATAVSRCLNSDVLSISPSFSAAYLSHAKAATQIFVKEPFTTDVSNDVSNEKLPSMSNSVDKSPFLPTYVPVSWEDDRDVGQHGNNSVTVDQKSSQPLKKQLEIEDYVPDSRTVYQADKKDLPLKGTAKLKAWFKRIIGPEDWSPKLQRILTAENEDDKTGGELALPAFPFAVQEASKLSCDPLFDASIDNTLQASHLILDAAERDLASIGECVTAAEQFIDSANQSISKTDRLLQRAIGKREAMISHLRSSTLPIGIALDCQGSPALLGYKIQLSCRPSMVSLLSVSSAHSSKVSIAPTLTENEDEDTRIVRRLILRKLEAQTSGVWDEVDKALGWLQIVKEVVRGVKRRAYL